MEWADRRAKAHTIPELIQRDWGIRTDRWKKARAEVESVKEGPVRFVRQNNPPTAKTVGGCFRPDGSSAMQVLNVIRPEFVGRANDDDLQLRELYRTLDEQFFQHIVNSLPTRSAFVLLAAVIMTGGIFPHGKSPPFVLALPHVLRLPVTSSSGGICRRSGKGEDDFAGANQRQRGRMY